MARATQGGVESEIRQAGGVVFRTVGGRTEYLVITTRDRRTWIFPKGHVEAGESDVDAALREVLEESGVSGAAVATLDPPHRFRAAGEQHVVRYILVCALDDAGEPEEGREKRWVSLEDALVLLSQPDARRLILTAHRLVEQMHPAPERLPELLLAEHHHLTRTLRQTERHAELRVAVLALLLIAAVAFDGSPVARGVALSAVLTVGLSTLGKTVRDAALGNRIRSALSEVRSALGRESDPLAFDPSDAPIPRSIGGSLTQGGALPIVAGVAGLVLTAIAHWWSMTLPP